MVFQILLWWFTAALVTALVRAVWLHRKYGRRY